MASRVLRMARVPVGGLLVVRGAQYVDLIEALVARQSSIAVVVVDHDADRAASLHEELDRRGRGALLRTFVSAADDLVVAAPDAVAHITSSQREAEAVIKAAHDALVLGGRFVSVLTVPALAAVDLGSGDEALASDTEVWFEPLFGQESDRDVRTALARFAIGTKQA